MPQKVLQTNWSGSVPLSTSQRLPDREADIARIVEEARQAKVSLRVIGSAHSSSSILPTDAMVVRLDQFKHCEIDTEAQTASIGAGVTIREAGEWLAASGLSMHTMGDVDAQTVIGAISTGTHGSGKRAQNLSAMLLGARIVNAVGDVIELDQHTTPEILPALRLSLGTLGIITRATISLEPLRALRREEWCGPARYCLDQIDALVDAYTYVDCYWYPRSDEVKIRITNPLEQPISAVADARCTGREEGMLHQVIPRPKHLSLKFEESEYAVPVAAWRECFEEIRHRVLTLHRRTVGWRLLVRWIAADQTLLSPAYQQDCVAISLHQNATLPYEDYFRDIEPIFCAYGGRPHWAKKYYLAPAEIRSICPGFAQFAAIRKRADPHGVFLTPFLRQLFLECNDTEKML